MRTHPRALRLIAGAAAGALLAQLGVGTVAADQGVARDIDEACSVATRSSFTDRPAEGFGDAVDCVAHLGITTGATATTYAPAAPVVRGQMASFIVRTGEVAGTSVAGAGVDAFADDDGSVHEPAVDLLAASGVATGFPDGTFRPLAEVTRGQVASFIARELALITGAELPEAASDYFADDDGTTHEAAVDALAEIGVVAGTSGATYAPNAPVTRGQMALLLARALDWLTETRATPLARIDVRDATGSPELVSAVPATSGSTTTVTFTFDEPVASTTILTDGFSVIGFDGTPTTATSATRDDDAPEVVRATFPTGSARLATTATVARNTVQDASGNLGPEAAVPLQDVDLLAGTTSAPDLVSVSRLGASAVDFSFDEAAFVLEPAGYHLVLADGTVKGSTDVIAGDGTIKHTVSFDLSDAEAAQVVRGHVEQGSVADAAQVAPSDPKAPDQPEGNVNPQQAVTISVGGAIPGIPDLLAVAIDVGADQVRYTFDEAVDLVDPDGAPGAPTPFRVYHLDGGEAASGTAAKAAGEPRAVVVTFPTGTVTSLVSGGSVDAGAVTSSATGEPNRVDEEGLERSLDAGETAAPDLVRAGRVQQAGTDPLEPSTLRRVVFEFDRRVTLVAEDGFSVYDAAGARTRLEGCAVADERAVACTADSLDAPALFAAMGEATLAAVHQGAVRDLSGAFPSHAASAVL